MKIRLDRLDQEPFSWRESLRISRDEVAHPEVLDLGEVAWTGTISRSSEGYLLRASISYTQTLGCTRCLALVEHNVASELTTLILVRPGGRDSDPAEHQLTEDDLGTLVLESPQLDTLPLAQAEVQMSVPMKLLCRDDCAGLCEHCGADLNVGPCGCKPPPDPRWVALSRWKQGTG